MIDLNSYLMLLDKNTDGLRKLVGDLGEEANHRMEFSSWSVLEVLEHLLITERFVHGLLARPTEKNAEKTELHGAERLERMLVDLRSRKVKAPDMLEPKGEIDSVDSFISKFSALRNKLAEDLKSGKIVVDQRVHSHPMLGEMTVSDWLHFILSHARRHMEQIKDILESSRKSQ